MCRFPIILKNIVYVFKICLKHTPNTLPRTSRRPRRGVLGSVLKVFFENILNTYAVVFSKESGICTSMVFKITHMQAFQTTMIYEGRKMAGDANTQIIHKYVHLCLLYIQRRHPPIMDSAKVGGRPKASHPLLWRWPKAASIMGLIMRLNIKRPHMQFI